MIFFFWQDPKIYKPIDDDDDWDTDNELEMEFLQATLHDQISSILELLLVTCCILGFN